MPKKPLPPPPPEPWLGRAAFRLAALAFTVAGVLIALVALGQFAREQLRGADRYAFPFAAIECAPPPGTGRGEFLEQVQYLAALPERLDLLDATLARRLAEAFALHPWVEHVERVEVTGTGVRLLLTHRRPILAVRQGDQLRVVDGNGVLLPREARTDGLPIYGGEAKAPSGPAGTRWGDRGVEAAARRAAGK